jgi:hypothetical protein
MTASRKPRAVGVTEELTTSRATAAEEASVGVAEVVTTARIRVAEEPAARTTVAAVADEPMSRGLGFGGGEPERTRGRRRNAGCYDFNFKSVGVPLKAWRRVFPKPKRGIWPTCHLVL